MKTYDWIVVGGGITGAALYYELAKQGLSVLLVEQDATLQGATQYSYGGLAFWSGTTDLTRQLCEEGMAIHRALPEELDAATDFRELDLVLTIAPDADPQQMEAAYARFAIPPKLLSVAEACALEPLLNPAGISGVLTVRHGHVDAAKLSEAYCQAGLRLGGERAIAQVTDFLRQGDAVGDTVSGIVTSTGTYHAANTIVCAGGFTRSLLKTAGVSVPVYFTHTEVMEMPAAGVRLNSLLMPADLQRFILEAAATEEDALWEEPGIEPAPDILDAGAVQFLDGTIRVGQISHAFTDPHAEVDIKTSEARMRQAIAQVAPKLADLPGRTHHCLVAFSRDRLPLVGQIPGMQGIQVFSGFSNPLVFVPAYARHFAIYATTGTDEVIAQVSLERFV